MCADPALTYAVFAFGTENRYTALNAYSQANISGAHRLTASEGIDLLYIGTNISEALEKARSREFVIEIATRHLMRSDAQLEIEPTATLYERIMKLPEGPARLETPKRKQMKEKLEGVHK